ncbi:MAG: hypothetical protein ACTHNK_11970 [Thermomicrobiales bacterium]|nr:hypothetical protein [Thermomicrobiales bacterium]
MGTPESGYWIRFEDVDGDIVEDAMPVDSLPEVGALLPIRGTHYEIMEEWTDRSFVAEGGPEIVVFTVKPLV